VEYVCREHRLAFTFPKGPDRPAVSVVAAVLFFVGPPPDIRGTRGEEKGRSMRQPINQEELAVCERIIRLYAPYVLVRCTRYTNRHRQAQQIGAYTLVTTCIIVRELQYVGQFGRIVDVMAGVVGPDVLSGGQGEDWGGQDDKPLIGDERMSTIADALNSLKRPLREVLVLHHVARREADDLARLLQEPMAEVVAGISRAERLLAKRLEGLWDEGRGAGAADVRSLLAQFAAGLDTGWIQEVTDYAMDYLAQRVRP